ncbi:MAG TPA: sigma-70 family RNA polymerase sigma factor [Solirubrobacteraceae bacterium]|nr:sigma-70 family RNA polymerase sigma factor [Solirubrobacteraceae bacterium]
MRSDAALVERFRAGDQEAFAVLYERHRAIVLAVALGVLGSRHDAEDAAQDTFASLAVALRTNVPRDLRPWLARVARNAAIDAVRRRRAVAAADEVPERPASASTEVKAELESVLAGLRELPETQRTALLMRELGGHSYQEIGDLLALDEAAVRGLIARGRMGLRAHREASEMPCAAAREVLATELDGRPRDRTVRRHLRSCASCRAYGHALRRDARSLRAFVPAPVGGLAGGGALLGGFAAKTVLTGGVLTQVTAACAVSVCAVGGIALLDPAWPAHPASPLRAAPAASPRAAGRSALAAPLPARARALTLGASAAPAAVTGGAAPASEAITGHRRTPSRGAKVASSPSLILIHPFQFPDGGRPAHLGPGASPAAGSTPTGAMPSPSPRYPGSPTPSWPTASGLAPGPSDTSPTSGTSSTSGASPTSGTSSTSGTSPTWGSTPTSGTSPTSSSGGWSGGTGTGSAGSSPTTRTPSSADQTGEVTLGGFSR